MAKSHTRTLSRYNANWLWPEEEEEEEEEEEINFIISQQQQQLYSFIHPAISIAPLHVLYYL